ncbi:WD repeat-containing protein 70 [Smittium culicis]|uniref:WD repeat-containing protein 70 n=1 Tax=Smittium culicis TaxID=133412 RepID=A0A1R1XH30_9FUNG|nr:WD repeat-containing protein 70 [Smittium culicis]
MSLNKNNSKGFSIGGSLNFAKLYKDSKGGSKTTKVSDSTIDIIKSNLKNEKNPSSNHENISDGKQSSLLREQFYEQKIKTGLVPIEKSANLDGHTKAVTAIDWDNSGSRMITGGYDYLVKFWNFGAMDSSLRSFREIEPTEGNQINDLKFSYNGEMFLTATGSPRAKIFDRDGILINEYKRGDMYIRDMRHTSGHVASLNSVYWNPKDKSEFATCASDSTHLENAHLNQFGASSLELDSTGYKLLSRGLDKTVKLWDIRMFKKPTSSIENIYCDYPQTNACFSPNEKIVLATREENSGTSEKAKANPSLVFLDSSNLEILYEAQVPIDSSNDNSVIQGSIVGKKNPLGTIDRIANPSLVKVIWHKSLNQIAVSKSNGQVAIYYDPENSTKGIKMCLSKASKPSFGSSGVYAGDLEGRIITPHSLPLFKSTTSGSNKRRMEKIRKDPIASRKPEPPVRGPGKDGYIGTSETQYIMQNIIKDTTRDEDPREALLKHAAAAEESPYWVAPAYKKNQPSSIFDETGMKDEPELKRRK